MKAAAIDKARERLRRAATAIADIERANTQHAFRDAWESYLISIKAIGEVLQTGARGDKPSEKALAALWDDVRADPLLGYLIEARNVEEHGLERSANYESASLMIGGPGESVMLNGTLGGGMMVTPMYGSKVTIIQAPQATRLLPVIDRRGKEWPVPTEHLGKPVADPSPTAVARLGLTHFTMIVKVAAGMALSSR